MCVWEVDGAQEDSVPNGARSHSEIITIPGTRLPLIATYNFPGISEMQHHTGSFGTCSPPTL